MAITQFFTAMSLVLAGFIPALCADEKPWRSLTLIENDQIASGWKQIGWGRFVVEGENLRTECDERGLGLLLYDPEKFGNCQIRVVFKSQDPKSNSGVFVRIDDRILDWRDKPTIAVKREPGGKLSAGMLHRLMTASDEHQGPWFAVHHGYEVQICDRADPIHRTGAIYSLATSAYEAKKPSDEWRTMIITLKDNLILVEIDGQRVTTFDPDSPDVPRQREWYEPLREPLRPTSGYIGLQTHDPGDVVYFREIAVRSLN